MKRSAVSLTQQPKASPIDPKQNLYALRSCWAAACLHAVLREKLLGEILLSIDTSALPQTPEAQVVAELVKVANAFTSEGSEAVSLEGLITVWAIMNPAVVQHKTAQRKGILVELKPPSRVEQCALEGYTFVLNCINAVLAETGNVKVCSTTNQQ